MRQVIVFALLLTAMFQLSACTVAVTPENVLFHDDEHPDLDMGKIGSTLVDRRLDPVSLRHADGAISRGVHLIKPGSRAVIVYFSGNKMRLADRGAILLPRFAMLDADVFWMDYRGQGASEGQPSLETLQGDVADLIALAAREKKPVILHGLSMGSLLAGRAAKNPQVAALVLEGGISTMSQVVDATTPEWLHALISVKVDPRLATFDNLAMLATYEKPLLVLVGSRDEETPPTLSQRLYEAARSPNKIMVVVPDKTHDDAMTSSEAIMAYRRLISSLR